MERIKIHERVEEGPRLIAAARKKAKKSHPSRTDENRNYPLSDARGIILGDIARGIKMSVVKKVKIRK